MSEQTIRDTFAAELDSLSTRLSFLQGSVDHLQMWVDAQVRLLAEHEPIRALFEKETVAGLMVAKITTAQDLVEAVNQVFHGLER